MGYEEVLGEVLDTAEEVDTIMEVEWVGVVLRSWLKEKFTLRSQVERGKDAYMNVVGKLLMQIFLHGGRVGNMYGGG